MIRIEQLSVAFGSFIAVDDLSVRVPKAELFGCLGPNGAGKTTIIRVLIGNQQPTKGTVTVAGFSIPRQICAVKGEFGYVPDHENHIDELTGRENLTLFAQLYGLSHHEVEETLERLQLAESADLPVRVYSKGMRRKLLIAREIMHQPRVLYLDEPTANLDAHSTALVRELLQDLASSGTTVFLTTHNMQEVEQICDRVAILCRGKLIACDTPSNFVLQHAERKVCVQYDNNGTTRRILLDLDSTADTNQLARLVREQRCTGIHSKDFQFEDVFRKLTGEAYE